MGSLDSTWDRHQCSLESILDSKERALCLRFAHTDLKLFRFRDRMPSSSMSCCCHPLVEEDFLTWAAAVGAIEVAVVLAAAMAIEVAIA